MNRLPLLAMPTPHGFGHVAELAPVLDAVHRRRPDVRITLRTTVPRGALASLVEAPFEHVPEAVDIGMVMASATEVRPKASLTRYASGLEDSKEAAAAGRSVATTGSLSPARLYEYLPFNEAAPVFHPALRRKNSTPSRSRPYRWSHWIGTRSPLPDTRNV